MINFIRTGSDNRDFIELVKLLDADLAIRDGDKHASMISSIKLMISGMLLWPMKITNRQGVERLKSMSRTLWKLNECMFCLRIEKKGLLQ
jgi:hypothetical protein